MAVKYEYSDPREAFAVAERRIAECRRKGDGRLDLGWLGLAALPASLGELKQLQALSLEGNADLGLPEEVVAKWDKPAEILDYYFRIRGRGAAQPLNEFKLILVGRGGVGKTSLVHRLTAGQYKT